MPAGSGCTDSDTSSGLTWVVEHKDNVVRRYMDVCGYRDHKSVHRVHQYHATRVINTHHSRCPRRRPASPPRSSQACSPGTARTPGVSQRACVRRQKRDRHNWALSARYEAIFGPTHPAVAPAVYENTDTVSDTLGTECGSTMRGRTGEDPDGCCGGAGGHGGREEGTGKIGERATKPSGSRSETRGHGASYIGIRRLHGYG